MEVCYDAMSDSGILHNKAARQYCRAAYFNYGFE